MTWSCSSSNSPVWLVSQKEDIKPKGETRNREKIYSRINGLCELWTIGGSDNIISGLQKKNFVERPLFNFIKSIIYFGPGYIGAAPR